MDNEEDINNPLNEGKQNTHEDFIENTIEYANAIISKRFFNCGLYQCISFLFISVCWTIGNGWYAFVSVFTAYTPKHTCAYSSNLSITNSQCFYQVNDSQTQIKCDKWSFDDTLMKTTIITEYEFYCERNYYFEVAYSIEQSWYLFGALLFSFLADHFGRKPVLTLCLLSISLIGFVQYFIRNFYVYMILGLLMNTFASGLDTVCVPLVIEMSTKRKRTLFGIGMEHVWVLVLACLSPVAYIIRTWRELRGFIFILLGILGISSVWLVQESITWLISGNKFKRASKVLDKISKFNKLEELEYKQDREMLVNMFKQLKLQNSSHHEAKYKTILQDLLKHKRFCLFALILTLSWFITGLIYDGLTYLNASMGENLFLNWILLSLVELPGQLLCFYAVSKYGRVRIACVSLISSGFFLLLSLITSYFEHLWWLKLGVFMMAKFSITISFSTIILHTSELFPTKMRSFGYGLCLFASKLSAIVSPMISLYLTKLIPWLPRLIYAILSTSCGLIYLLLPDTLGKSLPNNIDEVVKWKT